MCAGWILAQCVLSNLFCEWLPHDNVAHTEFDDSPRENRVLTFADEHGDMLCEYVFLSRALLVCVLAMCVSCVRTCPSACTRLCLGLFVVAVLTIPSSQIWLLWHKCAESEYSSQGREHRPCRERTEKRGLLRHKLAFTTPYVLTTFICHIPPS